MVTIKKIADLCGVSRGTVDRVINDRGNVKPETKVRWLAYCFHQKATRFLMRSSAV